MVTKLNKSHDDFNRTSWPSQEFEARKRPMVTLQKGREFYRLYRHQTKPLPVSSQAVAYALGNRPYETRVDAKSKRHAIIDVASGQLKECYFPNIGEGRNTLVSPESSSKRINVSPASSKSVTLGNQSSDSDFRISISIWGSDRELLKKSVVCKFVFYQSVPLNNC